MTEYLTRYYEADQIKVWEVQVAHVGKMRKKYKLRVENLKYNEVGKSVLKTQAEIKWNDSFNSG